MSSGGQIVNTEMASAWAEEGVGWAAHWEHYDRGVAAHHAVLLQLAAVTDGEHVLDVGCGNGQLTRDLAARTPSGSALGVDLSTTMLTRARELADRTPNVSFEHADAQVQHFDRSFDLVVSRFGTMFFADRRAAFAHLAQALQPGGRLAMVVWQPRDDNAWLVTILGALLDGSLPPAPPEQAPSPFSLARPDHVRELLEGAGFSDVAVDSRVLPFWAGADADSALGFLLGTGAVRGALSGVPEADRQAAADRLREALGRHAGADGVVLDSAVHFVSARRR